MPVRRLSVLVLVAALGCETSPSGPPAPAFSAVAGPIVTTVTGGAQWVISSGPYAGLLRRFTFNALQPQDGPAEGAWELVIGSTILHGTISCMQLTEIDGKPAARLGGLVTDPKFSSFIAGTDIAWAAVDGGEGDGAMDATSNPVAFRNAPSGSAEAFCASGAVPDLTGNPPYSIDPITYGNVQIRSAGN